MKFALPSDFHMSLQDGRSKLSLLIVTGIFLNLFLAVFVSNASAVEMGEMYIRLDRMKASTATGGTVCMKPSATHTATLDAVKVTWPTGFTVNGTGSNWTGSGSTLGGATAMPGIAAATATVSTQTVTWTFASDQTISSGTMYCFSFGSSSTLTNSSAGNDKTGLGELTDTTPANSETSTYALSIVADDQITVDADVPATFSVSFSANAIDHGDLSASAADVGSPAITATIGTNAENGWVSWLTADSANGAALYSASTGDAISSTDTGSPVSLAGAGEGWVVDVQSSGGTVATEYDGNSTTSGGVVGTSFEQVASSSTVASADTVVLTSIARITATNKAANDYQETLTLVAAGNF